MSRSFFTRTIQFRNHRTSAKKSLHYMIIKSHALKKEKISCSEEEEIILFFFGAHTCWFISFSYIRTHREVIIRCVDLCHFWFYMQQITLSWRFHKYNEYAKGVKKICLKKKLQGGLLRWNLQAIEREQMSKWICESVALYFILWNEFHFVLFLKKFHSDRKILISDKMKVWLTIPARHGWKKKCLRG